MQNAVIAKAPATFMLAFLPHIGIVTLKSASAMSSGEIPSSSFPRIINPFLGHVT